MATICIPFTVSFPSAIKQPVNLNRTSLFPSNLSNPNQFSCPFSSIRARAKNSSSAAGQDTTRTSNESMGIDNLKRFFDLNVGNWSGSFHQFDADGNLMQKINTKLAVSTYGEGELTSLIQTLYTKQPPSSTSIAGYDDEPEWAEYKIKETNIFTADKYQQIGFFPNQRAFSLRYQTAGMLETVLRQGVLGEDDTGEESPKNLKLPSRRPAIVCENCLYSQEKDRRARAFHVMDPRNALEMLLIFVEDKDSGVLFLPFLDNDGDNANRVVPFLGKWKGHSITKRNGVYGSTNAEADTVALLEMDENSQLVEDITSTSDGQEVKLVHWMGTVSDNLLTFDGGYQLTFLPRGMYIRCPCDIAKSQSFHLEFSWLENPGKRQRLV